MSEQPSEGAIDHLHVDSAEAGVDMLVLRLGGELDSATAPRLIEAFTRTLSAAAVARVELELSELTFIDAAGVRSLLACGQAADAAGIVLKLRGPTPGVAHVLTALGLLDRFVVADEPAGPVAAPAGATFHGDDPEGWRQRSARIRREARETRDRARIAINNSKMIRPTDQ
ncbi:hypothetical protein Aab01nite_79940 [Paractinoplanes abujensis]|uniref:Anti-anti-sigma factor n=1 Tax=Paractinoplanes abujensis TaxID=882441 RepID=A0A7W7G2I4_9ACTN|nr:STAS domain-containing protein [Actinoplanes abujensis]MBB4693205.1 anti-anti-sigma factor [Actinoplanes abujensis]GID24404.1 hypothetical protein Aab01nite_79940 [Actinoplanes abujensis]